MSYSYEKMTFKKGQIVKLRCGYLVRITNFHNNSRLSWPIQGENIEDPERNYSFNIEGRYDYDTNGEKDHSNDIVEILPKEEYPELYL